MNIGEIAFNFGGFAVLGILNIWIALKLANMIQSVVVYLDERLQRLDQVIEMAEQFEIDPMEAQQMQIRNLIMQKIGDFIQNKVDNPIKRNEKGQFSSEPLLTEQTVE